MISYNNIMKTGLFIGRFQPFHKGHLHAIRFAQKEVDNLIVAVGSSQYVNTKDNPFSYDERREMIESTLKKEKIKHFKVYPVSDIGDDNKWVFHLEKSLPKFDVVLTGNEFVRGLFKQKGIPVRYVNFLEGINGTKIRDLILRGKDWKKLVPEESLNVIDHIDGIKRIILIFNKR